MNPDVRIASSWPWLGAALVAMALLLGGCGGTDEAIDTTDTSSTTDATTDDHNGRTDDAAAPDPGGRSATGETEVRPPTLGTKAPGIIEGGAARVINLLGPDGGVPLSDGDFADPFVLDTGLIPYGFTSNTTTANVPVSRPGLRGEVQLGDALPEVGSWSEEGLVWAPGVLEIASDGFVLYYTSLDMASGRQCIGVAVSGDATGPYVDDNEEPFICQVDLGGSIDASPVMVDGTPWLLWKGDGNCCGLPTTVWAQQLGPDGTALVGERHGMIVNDQSWEGPLVEGPSMVEVDGRLHLFYSANAWDTGEYAIGHAVCESVTGPCAKDPEPFLSSGDEFTGPGGQAFFIDRGGQLWMAFHAWLPGEVGYANGGQRRLFLEQIEFDEAGAPSVIG